MINIFEHYTSGEKLYEKMIAPVCEKHHLTNMEFTILMFLANNPQFDTAAEIVKYRHLTKSHVSISIRGLLERDLLHGGYLGNNRRSIHLTLTDRTAGIIEDGHDAQQQFRNALFAGFSQEELSLLNQFIERVDRNMDEYGNTPVEGEEADGK